MSDAVDLFVKATEAMVAEMRTELVLEGRLSVHRLPGGNMRVVLKWDGGEVRREITPEMVDAVEDLFRTP